MKGELNYVKPTRPRALSCLFLVFRLTFTRFKGPFARDLLGPWLFKNNKNILNVQSTGIL